MPTVQCVTSSKGILKKILFALFWLTLVVASQAALAQDDQTNADAPERVVWRKTPIFVPLTVGEERLIHFPDAVSIGLPTSLTPLLRSQSINGTLYLLAKQPFDTTRVLVRSETGGPVYVLDVSAAPKSADRAPLPDLQVHLETPKTKDSATFAALANTNSTSWGYVALTRYAAQQLYAPQRLLPNAVGVVAVPVRVEPVPLVRGGQVEAVPVAAWKAGRQYVTAVRLTNRTQQAMVLDPRELRGAWLAATFQHNRLLPSGTDADTTAVYLVSDRPFGAAL